MDLFEVLFKIFAYGLTIFIAIAVPYELITAFIDDRKRTKKIQRERQLEQEDEDFKNRSQYKNALDVVFETNDEAIKAVMENGRVNRKIAIDVISAVCLPQYKYGSYLIEHIESIRAEIIETYGAAGAVSRFAFVLALYKEMNMINEDEEARYNKEMADVVLSAYKKGL